MTQLTGRMPTRGIQNLIPTLMEDVNSTGAVRLIEDGNYTYIATASAGTPLSSPNWRCRRIDKTNGMYIQWADGDTLFDNIATDLTALNYI